MSGLSYPDAAYCHLPSRILDHNPRLCTEMSRTIMATSITHVNRSTSLVCRFPMTKGIAGYVATTGCLLNIRNAYDDERFNRYLHCFGSQGRNNVVVKELQKNGRKQIEFRAANYVCSCNIIFMMPFCSCFMLDEMCAIQHLLLQIVLPSFKECGPNLLC